MFVLAASDWPKLSNQFYNFCIFNILIRKVELRKGLICSIILCYGQAMVTTFTHQPIDIIQRFEDMEDFKEFDKPDNRF